MNAEVGYALAFTTGLLGSLHCIGMCGGLVSAFFLKIGVKGGILPYLGYHAARITVYASLGALVGALGQVLERSNAFVELQMVLMIFAGVLVIFLGLDMLGIMKWNLSLEKVPVAPMKKLFRKVVDRGPLVGSFTGGALNGLIPCGLLYAVLISAATVGSALQGGLILAAFGAGTLPAMLSVSFVLGRIGARTRGLIYRLAAVVVIAMGARTLYAAYLMYLQSGGAGPDCH